MSIFYLMPLRVQEPELGYLQSVSRGGHYSLDWTTGLTFDLKCSIYMKKIMFYLCEKNYID